MFENFKGPYKKKYRNLNNKYKGLGKNMSGLPLHSNLFYA